MKHAVIVLGTRPEAIKLLPVYLELIKHGHFTVTLISTGQHKELLEDVFNVFRCEPDTTLNVMQPNQTLSSLTSRVFSALDNALPDKADVLIVQGDTTSTLVASIIAYYRGIPCAHVEAGLRSGDLKAPFPEEFNRRAVTLTARWHFAPTETAAKKLLAEGVDEGVHVVGNTSIDAALMISRQQQSASETLMEAVPELREPHGKIVLVTAHRRESFGQGIAGIVGAVHELAREHPTTTFVWPVHPNPNVRPVVIKILQKLPNVRLLGPIEYSDLLHVLSRSFMTLTDSGGIQEEAPAFSCPVLVLRERTERPEAIEAGCNVLVGTGTARIVRTFNEIVGDEARYGRMAESENPYGDGTASRRIADILFADLEARARPCS